MTRADKHMATIHDVPTNDLIEKMSKELEKVPAVQAPAWAPFVKTGASRELPPSRKDWWHVRAASVLRKVALKGPIGVSKLRVQYGGKKNRGVRTEKFVKGSGAITRRILQQLEKAGFIKQTKIGVHFGRVVTPQGQKFMDGAASMIFKEMGGKKLLVTPRPVEEKSAERPSEKPHPAEKPAPKPAEKPLPNPERPVPKPAPVAKPEAQ